jgi:hypothetical protein
VSVRAVVLLSTLASTGRYSQQRSFLGGWVSSTGTSPGKHPGHAALAGGAMRESKELFLLKNYGSLIQIIHIYVIFWIILYIKLHIIKLIIFVLFSCFLYI